MVDLETIALHEAGHAVMRWLRGLSATDVTANDDGGFCAGTGRAVHSESELLVSLAGFAVECGYAVGGRIDLAHSHGDDFDHARRILSETEYLRFRVNADRSGVFVQDVDAALLRYFARAGVELLPYSDLIEDIGQRLQIEGRLSARTVAAICREYVKRSRRVLSEEGNGDGNGQHREQRAR